MFEYANNPAFKEAIKIGDVALYVPAQETTYHASRFIAMQEQQIYAKNGCEKDVLEQALNYILERCNEDKPVHTFRTDIGVMCNNLLYRMKYPVDNKIALRMGAILTFMEGEDPNTCDVVWINKKLALADKNPDFYTFFLTLGVHNLNAYTNHLDTLTDSDYFRRREEQLQAFWPQSNPK